MTKTQMGFRNPLDRSCANKPLREHPQLEVSSVTVFKSCVVSTPLRAEL